MEEGCEKKQMTIRLPVDLREELQREADRRGDSFNETVVRLLRKAVKSDSFCSVFSLFFYFYISSGSNIKK